MTKGGPAWIQYMKILGPGLVTGASDDDPSGIATYAQAGAAHGLSFLWTALLTFPLMAAVQEICDRTALATGVGLGELARKRFRPTGRSIVAVLLVVLIVANTLNVAADLVAIGSGMSLLHAGPTWLWALVAGAVITALLARDSYAKIATVFKVLCLSLLVYLVDAVIVTHQWLHLLDNTFVPHFQFTKSYVALFVAILGTTISPYMFFWQSAQRVEEMRDEPQGGKRAVPIGSESFVLARRKQRTSRQDVFTGMAFSNIVMFATIATTAQTLHVHHVTNIESAAQAATALKPFAGRFASEIFAFGFIGSGLIAIPALAASGSTGLSGYLGRQWGFSQSIREAPVFYSLVATGTLGGTALSLLHVNPIKLLVVVAIINGIIAAPLLVIIMRVSNSRDIMGEYVNGRLANVLGWITAALMAAAAVAFFATGGLSF
ncbi:MAG: divalent metal cation transporter [Acidimicrobiaceae bacterium]|nr:divalent metal cation transporter [Acidimicrobiaceae bacterium]